MYELLNLAIGTPQQGAVNFSALHTLLVAVLSQLDMREMKTQWRDSLLGDDQLTHLQPVAGLRQYQHTETEQLRIQGGAEQDAEHGTELQEQTPASLSPTPSGTAADQWRLASRVQVCEDGVTKVRTAAHLMKQ